MFVEIDHVRMVLGNGVIHAQHKLVCERRMQWVLGSMPRAIKVHRVHTLPPFSFPIANRLKGVVGHPFHWPRLIAGVTHRHELAPCTWWSVMKPNAEAHPTPPRHLLPCADNIHLGADMHRIPRLIF